MRVLVVEPGWSPVEMEIDGSLESMQAVVGGLIQVIPLNRDGTVLICNEEGKIRQLRRNRVIRDENGKPIEIIMGTFFICQDCGNDFTGLSDAQVAKHQKVFNHPDIFRETPEGLLIISMAYDPMVNHCEDEV